MRFLALIMGNEDDWRALSEAELGDAGARIGAWYGLHAAAGRIVDGGRLTEKADARTIQLGRAGKSGDPSVTSGPHSSGDMSIGSYVLIEAPSLDEAIEVAAGWPGGGAIELRPLADMA